MTNSRSSHTYVEPKELALFSKYELQFGGTLFCWCCFLILMQLFYFFLLLKHMILELKIEVIFQCDKQFSKQQDPSELSQRSQPTIFFLGVLVSIFLEPITQTMRQDTKPGEDFTCGTALYYSIVFRRELGDCRKKASKSRKVNCQPV